MPGILLTSALYSLIITCLALFTAVIALAKGSSKVSLKNFKALSPLAPLGKKLYIKPKKSSADGGIKNLNLPLSLPRLLPFISENLFSAPTPSLSSNISLNLSLNFSLLDILACCTFDFTSS